LKVIKAIIIINVSFQNTLALYRSIGSKNPIGAARAFFKN